jgi:hypothetical protein
MDFILLDKEEKTMDGFMVCCHWAYFQWDEVSRIEVTLIDKEERVMDGLIQYTGWLLHGGRFAFTNSDPR